MPGSCLVCRQQLEGALESRYASVMHPRIWTDTHTRCVRCQRRLVDAYRGPERTFTILWSVYDSSRLSTRLSNFCVAECAPHHGRAYGCYRCGKVSRTSPQHTLTVVLDGGRRVLLYPACSIWHLDSIVEEVRGIRKGTCSACSLTYDAEGPHRPRLLVERYPVMDTSSWLDVWSWLGWLQMRLQGTSYILKEERYEVV
jgi:hypothetical protein